MILLHIKNHKLRVNDGFNKGLIEIDQPLSKLFKLPEGKRIYTHHLRKYIDPLFYLKN